MTDVFISYSRADIEFVRRLHEALTNQSREIWVDWKGIPPRAEWLAEIRAAIDSAESFVFVISPDSVVSRVCAEELQHAVKRNKRIVPIVRREVETESVEDALAKLNWLFFRDSDQFDTSFEKLLTALDTDLDWVRAHTRLLVRAVEWDNQERNTSYTLRGRDLKDSESWLTRAPENDPKPTSLQTQYVLTSRKVRTVRQGVTLGAIAFGVIVAVVLSLLAYFQNQERQRQQKIASARQLINQAEALRDLPPDQPEARDRLKESVQAAVQALTHFNELGMYSADADQAVRSGLALLPGLVAEHDFKLGEIGASMFDPTGRFLAVAHGRSKILVWDTVREQEVVAWSEEVPAMVSVLAVDVSVDGAYLATAAYDASPDVNASTVTVWQLPKGTARTQFQWQGRLEKLRLSPRGRYVYVLGSGSLWRWDVVNGEKLEPFSDGQRIIYDLDFSPDGHHMAIAFRERGTRKRIVRISDVRSGKEKSRWVSQKPIVSLRWTSDPQRILISAHKTVLLHDAVTGRLEASYPQTSSGLVLSPNGRLLAERMQNYTVQVRMALTGRQLFRVIHNAEVKSMAFRPDSNSFVTLSLVDQKIRLWELGSRSFADLSHEDPVTRVDFSSDAMLLFTGSAAHERWWELPAKNKALQTPRESSSGGIASEPRQYKVRASGWPNPRGEKNRVDILDMKGEYLSSQEFSSPVLAAAITRDSGRLAIATGKITRGGWELNLETWGVNRRERLGAVPYPNRLKDEYARFLAFTPDDRFIVSKSEVGFTLWDVEKLAQAVIVYHAAPRAIGFQPHGTLVATTGRDQKIRIWELPNGLEIARIEQIEPVKQLALSPDGRWLAALSDGVAHLWLLQPDDLIAQAYARLPNTKEFENLK